MTTANGQPGNTAFLEEICNELHEMLTKYVVSTGAMTDTDAFYQFKDELFDFVHRKVVQSFKNGIQVGMRQRGRRPEKPERQPQTRPNRNWKKHTKRQNG